MILRLIVLLFSLPLLAFSDSHKPKQYSIEQFLNTKTYLGASFNFDENKIRLTSNESGIFNIFEIPLKSGKQKQLTHSEHQAFTLVSNLPHDDRFICTSDELGNELHHLYLFENGKLRDLTPYKDAKASFHGWSRDFKSFFFTCNNRDPRYMDLYEMDIASWTPTRVYQNDEGYEIGTISPDKRLLSLVKIRNANDSDLYLVDLISKTLTHLSPHQDNSQYIPATFSVDSKHLYFLTDEKSDFTYLKRYTIASGKSETIFKADWDISDYSFSLHGRYSIMSIDQDGSTVVRIVDQKSGKEVPLPKIPDGDVVGVTISKSEKAMLLSVDGDRSPHNVYLFNPADLSVRKLTNSLSPDIDSTDLVDAKIIRYPSYDGLPIPALYYEPQGIQKGEKVPALIWVHGGPGGQSRKGYAYLIQYLVNHGYAVLAVNNRGSSGYGKNFFMAADLKHGEADLDDCIWAKKFLIATGKVDPEKIGIIGGSYGGYMTLAALAFRPQEMAVGIDIFGVSNWVRTLNSIPAWWESAREALYKKIGNPETQTAYLESISPLFHADKIVKPLLVIQGANDPRVLKVESDQIVEAVQKNGVPTEYVVFDDEGHGFANKQNSIVTGKAILEFLEKHLK